ncbi:MAG: ribonucleoside-triphosphate reductase, adenosylcobalamin-dependent [Cyanobacteria bacterium J06560_6]
MVQELERTRAKSPFPETAPAAYPVFYRTYSRRYDGGRRETWQDVCDRTLTGLVELGTLTSEERDLVSKMQRSLKAMPSGRWLWVGGTEWSKNPQNFSGAYNCTSTNVVDWRAFGLMMDLAMMGCGTGAVLEPKYINQLPKIRNKITVKMRGDVGMTIESQRREEAEIKVDEANSRVEIIAGDSRQGWVKSYQTLLELSTDERFDGEVEAIIDLSDIRPAGERLKGFGGMANPVKLPELYGRCAKILNNAIGRQLNSIECCLLIDEAAACVVAGNIRRCLPEDALVHTAKGLVPIKDVRVGDRVQTPVGYRKVVNKFDQGQQDVYEIETNGTYPRATLNHRVAVFKDAQGEVEWKRLVELSEGDRLMHSNQILTGTLTHLPVDTTAQRPQQSRTAKDIVIPDLTPNVAWLIGFTHGDGYVALGRNKHNKPYGRVEWAMNAEDNDPSLLETLRAKIDTGLAEFGVAATHGSVKGENTAKSVCSSIRLAEYFHAHIKQPNQSLEVPNFILQGSIDVRAAYLAGVMDSDGAANNRPPHLVTSVYRNFVRQVAAVLSSLGIAGRLSTTVPKNERWQVKYNLKLPALKQQYNALIAPHSAKGAIRVGIKMYGFTLSGAMMREVYSYSEMRGMGFQGSHSVDSNYERYVAEADLDLDIPVSVKGLGSYDHVQTYDIEVEDAHCFYCDGYLTHNSAGMRQFASDDDVATGAKENLWRQDEDGNWSIDPTKDALRMANHTRVFHEKPSAEDIETAVRKQFYSGEGAIQWAGEAERRAKGEGRYGLNPCGEIIGQDFHCNLAEIHLNQISPKDEQAQDDAFRAGAIAVAALLNHQFVESRYQNSREEDPIVGVSFTGFFDFCVKAFGVEWLEWFAAGRPDTMKGVEFKEQEKAYLSRWKKVVHETVWEYCDRHNIRRPNRCTTVQPAGTKSLLTGASSGWHPPKAQRFIRRITFRKDDPVALACMDYGYSVIPSQSDKDEKGNLLDDPFDPRCTEWLVELPVEVDWANLPGADEVSIEQFSALAQFDFYMQVQKYYTAHNTSATIELRENEIEPLARRITESIENDEGYVSAALLARFDDLQTFPRLPFEPISKDAYEAMLKEVRSRRKTDNFHAALEQHDAGELVEAGPAGCDSDKCLMPEKKPS